jgi:hypothetical protein
LHENDPDPGSGVFQGTVMILNVAFLLILAIFMFALMAWGFKNLPGEKWQIIGSVPVRKTEDGGWQGRNLTWYGFYNAVAYGFATALLLVLLGAYGISPFVILLIVIPLFAFCIPASRIIAGIVESKSSTFTVGGASFAGVICIPWIILMADAAGVAKTGNHLPVINGLAAVSIAYIFGESLGRLACLSFGCCYGKALSEVHPFIRRIFCGKSIVFYGKTKKIAYAHGLDGCRIIPIQAATSILYGVFGLTGIFLYLDGHSTAAFLTTLIFSQAWRFASEFLRADYRGKGKISAYQVMSLSLIPYAVILSLVFNDTRPDLPVLWKGVKTLWNPAVILSLQALWLIVFLYFGRSRVTGAEISFFVKKENI